MRGFVVVSGQPGSGKTTLARALAPALDLPLLSKDTIKEALLDSLGTGDLGWSRQLGQASHAVLYAVAAEARGGVLESHFWPGRAEPDLLALHPLLAQVHCWCPTELALARYRRRVADPDRHPGHLPQHQDPAAVASWAGQQPRALDLPCPLVRVDTTAPVDLDVVAGRIRLAAS